MYPTRRTGTSRATIDTSCLFEEERDSVQVSKIPEATRPHDANTVMAPSNELVVLDQSHDDTKLFRVTAYVSVKLRV